MAGNARVAESAAAAEQDFDAMNQTELRKAAKELGVRQKGVSVAELKAVCERAVRERQQQKSLNAWVAVQTEALGSASAERDANCAVTVEHMLKISHRQAVEWKSVLTPLFFDAQKRSSTEQAYWTPESAKKVRRLVSEPMSPARAT